MFKLLKHVTKIFWRKMIKIEILVNTLYVKLTSVRPTNVENRVVQVDLFTQVDKTG